MQNNPLNKFMDALRSAVTRVAKSDADRAAIDAEFDAAEESLAAEIDDTLDDDYAAALAGAKETTTEDTEMADETAVLKMFGAATAAELQARIAKADEAIAENTRLKVQMEQVAKQATDAIEQVQKMQAAQAQEARVAKARTMLGNIPADDERVGKLATVMAKLDATETEALDTVLKAASNAIEVAKLFEPSRPVHSTDANSAYGRLEAVAKTIQSAENVPMTTAMKRAMDRNPKLASDAVAEDTVQVRPIS